jgi:hypothetical protein
MILAKAKIGDFERFWSVFTGPGAEQRSKFGSKGAQVLHSKDDPSDVWVLFDWEQADYERFESDPGTMEIMGAAGLQGPPAHVTVESSPPVNA